MDYLSALKNKLFFAECLERYGPPCIGGAGDVPYEIKMEIIERFHLADTIYWEKGLWSLAQNGANEAFKDTTIPDGLLQRPDEYWAFEKELLFPKEAAGEAYGLPSPLFRLHSLFLMSTRIKFSIEEFKKYCPDEDVTPWLDRSYAVALYPVNIFLPTDEKGEYTKEPPWFSVSQPAWENYPANSVLWLTASLQFLNQTIAGLETLSVPRGDRRRAKKANRPEPTIKKVILRRKQSNQATQAREAFDYSCQWLVRPHWRRNHRESSQPIYVTGYVKGPPDKPLKQPTETIYHVAR
jgi:hypothetical protein